MRRQSTRGFSSKIFFRRGSFTRDDKRGPRFSGESFRLKRFHDRYNKSNYDTRGHGGINKNREALSDFDKCARTKVSQKCALLRKLRRVHGFSKGGETLWRAWGRLRARRNIHCRLLITSAPLYFTFRPFRFIPPFNFIFRRIFCYCYTVTRERIFERSPKNFINFIVTLVELQTARYSVNKPSQA